MSVHLDLHVRCPGLIVCRGFAEAVDRYCRDLGVPEGAFVEVTLASDRVISKVHRETLGVAGPTDCIAFPMEHPGVTGGPVFLGAFYLGVEEARRNGARLGHGLTREVAFVLAHGLLHLLGWEDGTPAEREEMFARQDELVAGLRGRGGKLPRLVAFRARGGGGR